MSHISLMFSTLRQCVVRGQWHLFPFSFIPLAGYCQVMQFENAAAHLKLFSRLQRHIVTVIILDLVYRYVLGHIGKFNITTMMLIIIAILLM